jgi:general secretion pathway protein D
LILRILAFAVLALTCWAGADSVAVRLAQEARKAHDSGQIVRAYLLYAEAAARDPQNPSYRANRDALESAAKLLAKANVETAPDIAADVKEAERTRNNPEPPIEHASERLWERDGNLLQPLPTVQASNAKHDFDIRADAKVVIEQVTSAYGVRAVLDPELQPEPNIRFQLTQADFHSAMEALTAATGTFVFPISKQAVYFASDTEQKREQLEPTVLLTFPLPDALGQKDLIEAANAVRGLMNMRAIGWDSETRMVLIRDRITRARIARSLLEALLLPKAQVAFEVQFLTFDSDISYHYGVSLQTAYQLVDFGHVGGFKSVLSNVTGNFLRFGGGATIIGVGLTDAMLFATYSKSTSRILFDATVVVSDGQTANFHVGDKYPIPTTTYTGTQQSSSIYNPIGQVTMEDLGLVLKLTPRVNGDGDVSLDVEAAYRALGTQVIDSIPTIAEREFKGTVTLAHGQWAVLTGIDQNTFSTTQNALAGLGQIPALNQILSEHTRDTQRSNTLVLIKPTITSLPMSAEISPQYLLGPARGERVLL